MSKIYEVDRMISYFQNEAENSPNEEKWQEGVRAAQYWKSIIEGSAISYEDIVSLKNTSGCDISVKQ